MNADHGKGGLRIGQSAGLERIVYPAVTARSIANVQEVGCGLAGYCGSEVI